MQKTKAVWIILLSGSFLLLTACSTHVGEKQDAKTMVQAPENVYRQHCANCHGGNLQGGFGPALTGIEKKYTREGILTIIQKGKGDMPSQDYVKKEDQQKLAEWLSGSK